MPPGHANDVIAARVVASLTAASMTVLAADGAGIGAEHSADKVSLIEARIAALVDLDGCFSIVVAGSARGSAAAVSGATAVEE
jgi:hypothetical protein